MFNPVGSLTTPYDLSTGDRAYIRGLSVLEYIDLTRQGFFNVKAFASTDYVRIAYATIEGIERDGDTSFDPELYLDKLEVSELVELGKVAVDELTQLTDELEAQARGYTRFLYMGDDDKTRKQLDTYNCKRCLMGGYYDSGRKRFCGRFTADEAEMIKAELRSEDLSMEKPGKGSGVTPKKYSALKRKSRRKKKRSSHSEDLLLNNFKFPECPVSWIPDWLWQAGNVLYHSDKSNVPFFSGGLADQPYQMYRLSRIIGSESAAIDEERREKNG